MHLSQEIINELIEKNYGGTCVFDDETKIFEVHLSDRQNSIDLFNKIYQPVVCYAETSNEAILHAISRLNELRFTQKDV